MQDNIWTLRKSKNATIFFNDTATPEIYTLTLHDALPISGDSATATRRTGASAASHAVAGVRGGLRVRDSLVRSEEHTSELQSQSNLVCRLLLVKKSNDLLRLLMAAPQWRLRHSLHSTTLT